MSILNITNLTDNPEQTIRDKYIRAFDELEQEDNIKIDDTRRYDFIDNQIDSLEEQMEEAQGVKEWFNNE